MCAQDQGYTCSGDFPDERSECNFSCTCAHAWEPRGVSPVGVAFNPLFPPLGVSWLDRFRVACGTVLVLLGDNSGGQGYSHSSALRADRCVSRESLCRSMRSSGCYRASWELIWRFLPASVYPETGTGFVRPKHVAVSIVTLRRR
jgi:hypothetical protein